MQASAVVVVLLGSEDPDEIIRAILGFIITQHHITRVKVERPTQHHPTTRVVLGTLENLGLWLPNMGIGFGNGLGNGHVCYCRRRRTCRGRKQRTMLNLQVTRRCQFARMR
jgi:hypothetical protein